MGVRNRILLLLVGLLVIVTAGFTLTLYRTQRHSFESGVDRELQTAALMARELLPPGYHDRITGKDSVSTEQYQQIVGKFNQLCRETDIEYLWSLMVLDDKVVFTSATSPSKDVSKRDHAGFLEVHTNPELYTETLRTMQPHFQVNSDKWGAIRAVLVPFRDGQGRPWLVGASRNMRLLEAQVRATLISSLLAGIIVLVIGTVACLLLANSLSRPIEQLTSAAARIATGDLTQTIHIRGARELEALGDSINTMTQAIRARMEELAENRENLHITLQSIGDAVIATDSHGAVSWMNPVAESLTCWRQDQAQGKALEEVFRIINAQTRQTVENPVKRVLREGQVVGLANHTVLLAQDGTERQIADSAAPIRGKDQAILGVVLVFRDVTEQYAMDEALRESEEKFRSLFQAMTEGVALHELICDAAGTPVDYRILDINPAYTRHTGLELEKARHALASSVYGASTPPYLDIYAGVATGGAPCSFDTFFQPLKRHFSILVFSPSKGRFATVFEDITDRKLMEERLRQAQKMEAIGQLAGGVAHDFRNQLTVINGYAELLLRRSLIHQEGQTSMEEILRAAARGAQLTRQLLAFSRKDMLQPRVVSLDRLIDNMADALRRLVGEDITVSITGCGDDCAVNLAADQFEHTMMNLAANARDAMPNGGRLEIQTTGVELDQPFIAAHPPAKPGKYVLLSIGDTGSGMDQQTLARIFEPFFTTKELGQGTGLGLAMVYGFVRQSGGFVTVDSAPGEGTTVRIYFARAEQPAEASPQTPQPSQTPRGSETILVVEDEQPIRRLLIQNLQEDGYTVLEAANAQEAWQIAGAHQARIDLLITDVVMPGTSGVELATRLRNDSRGLPVLFLSGYGGKDLAQRGVNLVEAELLVKPFRHTDLAKTVRRILDKKNNNPK